MTEENGVLAHIDELYSRANKAQGMLDGTGDREIRGGKKREAFKNAREEGYNLWKSGNAEGYNVAELPEDPSGVLPEQAKGLAGQIYGDSLEAAATELHDKREDIIAKISDKGIEYLAGRRVIQESNPGISKLMKAQAAYEEAQKLTQSFRDAGKYRDVLKSQDEKTQELLVKMALDSLEEEINKNGKYKTDFSRKLAYQSAKVALLTGVASAKYMIAGAEKIEKNAKAVLEIEQKQAGGDLRKSVSTALDDLIDGSSEDIQRALPLMSELYRVEEVVKKHEEEMRKAA